jgi:hypothetical protein
VPSKTRRTRFPIKKGARLPDADRATFDPKKLTDYALDSTKDPGKAAGFAQLGVGPGDWQYVHEWVLQRLPTSEATHVRFAPGRVEFTVAIPFLGPNKRAGVLVTGWCADGRGTPWLSTIYAKPDYGPGDAD